MSEDDKHDFEVVDMDEAPSPFEIAEVIDATTNVVMTPEDDERFGDEDTFWVYSVGMKDNHGIEDVEIRGVNSMFQFTAVSLINEVNGYRLAFPDNPMLVGQTVKWDTGVMRIAQGEDWAGAYEWKAKDMIRLISMHSPIGCRCCDMETAGVEP